MTSYSPKVMIINDKSRTIACGKKPDVSYDNLCFV